MKQKFKKSTEALIGIFLLCSASHTIYQFDTPFFGGGVFATIFLAAFLTSLNRVIFDSYEKKYKESFFEIVSSLKVAYFILLSFFFLKLIQMDPVSWGRFWEQISLSSLFVRIITPSTFIMMILYAIEKYLLAYKKSNGCNGGCHCKK